MGLAAQVRSALSLSLHVTSGWFLSVPICSGAMECEAVRGAAGWRPLPPLSLLARQASLPSPTPRAGDSLLFWDTLSVQGDSLNPALCLDFLWK